MDATVDSGATRQGWSRGVGSLCSAPTSGATLTSAEWLVNPRSFRGRSMVTVLMVAAVTLGAACTIDDRPVTSDDCVGKWRAAQSSLDRLERFLPEDSKLRDVTPQLELRSDGTLEAYDFPLGRDLTSDIVITGEGTWKLTEWSTRFNLSLRLVCSSTGDHYRTNHGVVRTRGSLQFRVCYGDPDSGRCVEFKPSGPNGDLDS